MKHLKLLSLAFCAFMMGISAYAQTDVTDKVGTSVDAWHGGGTYSSSVERYYGSFPCAETPLYQDIADLDPGVYMATMKATSNLAWIASDLVDGDDTYAYVYATTTLDGVKTDKIEKSYFPAHRSTGVSQYYNRSVVIELERGENLQLGLGLDNLSLSNWHTIQIVSLIRYDSFDQLVAPLKAPLKAKLDEMNSYYTHSKDNNAGTAKAPFKAAIDEAQSLYDSKTTYRDAVEAADDFAQAIKNLDAAYQVYAMSGAIPEAGYPFDITFKVLNPTFGNNSADGWTANPAPGFQTFGNAEYFMKDFTISQTLTDMPKGKYMLKVKAFQRPGDAGDVVPAYINAEDQENGTFGVQAEIFVNTGSQKIKNSASAMRTAALGKGGNESSVLVGETTYYIPNDMNSADKYFSAGYYENEVELLCTTGEVQFGFRSNDAGKDKYWVIFDDFRLYLTDAIDLSAYEEQLAEAVAEAQKQMQKDVPQAVKDAIQAVIDANNKKWDTADEYSDAITAINNSYNGIDAIVAAYADFNNIYPQVKALCDVADYKELTPGAHKTLADALSTLKEQVEKATTADAVKAVNADLKAAGLSYANNAEPTGNAKFDLTFILPNANLDGLPTWQGAEGWYTEQPDGNSQVMTNDEITSEDGNYTAFYEYWSNPAKANNLFTLYQKIDELAAGIYGMSCYAFAKDQYTGNNVRGVKFFANDTEGSTIQSDRLAPASIEFVQEEAGEVKIGLKAVEGNTCNWMGIGYVELYKLPNEKVAVISDNDTESPAAGAYTTINANIQLLEGLNTLVLPFATTKEEIGAEKVFAYNGSEKRGSSLYLTFTEAESLSANTPYLIKMAEDKALTSFENKTVAEPTDLTVKDGNAQYDFIGTYSAYAKGESPIAAGDYIAGKENILKANGGNAIKAYRAFLKKTGDENISYVALEMNGEVVDGIEAAEIVNSLTGDIYNLNGQKVSKALKGIYIINGQKVVVK